MKTNKLKFWIAGILLAAGLFTLSVRSNKSPQNLIWSDMDGYYVYLPAVFIHQGFVREAARDTNYLQVWPGTDKIFTKYTCGVSLLESPFFIVAHILSEPLGFAPDGHSLIYCYLLMISAIFCLMAGSVLLWRVCRKYYSDKSVILAITCLFLGTNMYYYTIFQPTMSHIYSFFMYACLLYLTEKIIVERTYNRSHFALAGLVSGLVILIRPTSAIVLVYPVYRFIKSTDDKPGWFRKNLKYCMLALLSGMIVFIPQLIYWKHVTGEWFMWSYGEESFKYWKEPKLFRVLFDAWNGWLLYSPVAAIPLIGLIQERHRNRHGERVVIFIFALATWLFASWWAWWFGGAFGHRCYVEYCAFLVLPFSGIIEKAAQNRVRSVLFGALCVVLVYYSMGLTYNYRAPWDGPDWTYEKVAVEIERLVHFQF